MQSSNLHHLNSEFRQQLAIEARNSALEPSHAASVAKIDANVEYIRNTTQRSQNETCHALKDIHDWVDQIPGMSAEQLSVLKDMLRQLGAALPGDSPQPKQTDGLDPSRDISEPDSKDIPNAKLSECNVAFSESVNRLYSLAEQKESHTLTTHSLRLEILKPC